MRINCDFTAVNLDAVNGRSEARRHAQPPKTSRLSGLAVKRDGAAGQGGCETAVPGTIPRICSRCGQHPAAGPKQSRCRDCRARLEQRRRVPVQREQKVCVRCGQSFEPKGGVRRCDDCRLAADPKTSQCPYCEAVYVSHDDTRKGVAERMHHHMRRCLA